MSTFAIPSANRFRRKEAYVLPSISTAVAMRVRSDQGLELATGIKTWRDMSANARHPTNGTGASQATLVANQINGYPIVRYDGSDDYHQIAFTLNQPFTVFFVHKSVALGAPGVNYCVYDGQAADAGLRSDNTPRYYMFAANATPLISSALANGSFAYTTAVYNGASSYIRVGGTQTGAADAGANNAGGITIGARFTGLNNAQIDVAEMIVYAGAVSAPDVLLVEAYLSGRYAL